MKKMKIMICAVCCALLLPACGKSGQSDNISQENAGQEESSSTPVSEENQGNIQIDMIGGDKEDSPDGEGTGENDPEPVRTADRIRMEAYASVLRGIYYDHEFPGRESLGYDELLDAVYNEFSVYDVDMDGAKELIVLYTTTYYGGMAELIYDYDWSENSVREEFCEFPDVTFYDNGIVEVLSSHNHGMAGDASIEEFWPYTFYQYDLPSDSYVPLANVDAWRKSFTETDYEGNPFPEETDVDGDGMVFYIMPGGEYSLNTPVDGEAYRQWRASYLEGANVIEIPFMELTEENIASITDNGESAQYEVFHGTWEVTASYQWASVSSLSSEEAETYVGTTVAYLPEEILVNGKTETSGIPAYGANVYTEEALVSDYRANLGEWWNGISEVTYVELLSSEPFFGSRFFIADEDALWIYYEGVFFFAKRTDS